MGARHGKQQEPGKQYDFEMHTDLDEGRFPTLTEYHSSLMRKYLTEELWNELKDLRTESAGWSLADIVNTGCINEHARIGLWAGDKESYHLFAKIFNPVIKDFHHVYTLGQRHETDLDPGKLIGDIEDPSLIETTRVRLARNIHGFPLHPVSRDHLVQIETFMMKVFGGLTGDLAGTYHSLSNADLGDLRHTLGDNYVFDRSDPVQAAAGAYNFWPTGRGVYTNHDKTFCVWLNEEDHLRMFTLRKGGAVREAYEQLARGAEAIESGIRHVTGNEKAFLSDELFGMLTSCPSNLGTGLRCSVLMNLHSLHKVEGAAELNTLVHHMGCCLHATHGRHAEIADICYVSNLYCLGRPEYELVQNLIDAVNKLTDLELDATCLGS